MTIQEIRSRLMTELLLLAVEPNVKCRVEKIEETHRRINAIDRYLSENPDGSVEIGAALGAKSK